MDLLLAYRPILDPIDAHGPWYVLIVPIAILLAFGYKAVRTPDVNGKFDLGLYLRQVVVFTVQILIAMIGLYLFSVFTIAWALPRLT